MAGWGPVVTGVGGAYRGRARPHGHGRTSSPIPPAPMPPLPSLTSPPQPSRITRRVGSPRSPPRTGSSRGTAPPLLGTLGQGRAPPLPPTVPPRPQLGHPHPPPPAPAPYTWVSCSSRSVAVPGSGGPLRGPPSPSSLASRAWGASTLPGGSFLGVLVPMGDTEDVCFVMSHHSTPGGSRVRLVGPAGKGVRWWGGGGGGGTPVLGHIPTRPPASPGRELSRSPPTTVVRVPSAP